MNTINVLILRTAGTNCDQETKIAFELFNVKVKLLHVNDLVKGKAGISDYQIIAFPGGFTYGDDIAAGKILANELKMKLQEHLQKFLDRNGLMIGICNGFQILVKMGFLPGMSIWQQEATLACNDSGKFEDRWVYLKKPETRPLEDLPKGKSSSWSPRRGNQKPDPSKIYQKVNPRVGVPEGETGNPPPQKVTQGEISELESSKGKLGSQCVWTRGIDEIIYLPVAHGEGKFIVKDNTVLEQMKVNGQIVFQYSDKQGNAPGYPDDPNGSVEHIAGICDPTGRIFGLMPHPERFVFKTQHPHWTRKKNDFIPDGFKIFESAVNFLKKA